MSNVIPIIPQQVVNLVLQWALYLASIGIPVFPLHFVDEEGTCSCGNPECRKGVPGNKAGKHPMTTHGLLDATTDSDKVRHFWDGEPDANLGIRTGAESGIVVVDIDPRHNGHITWQQLVAQHGQPPLTPMVTTGSGGWHLYYRHPGFHIGNRQNMAPGIDLRGDGGYVVGPASNHVDGEYLPQPHGYIPDIPLAAMPQWLLALAMGNSPVPTSATAVPADAIVHPNRHPTLLSMAGSMRNKGFSKPGIEAALRAENLARCSPPLEEKEISKLVAGAMKFPAGQLPKGKIHSFPPREEAIQQTRSAFESASDPKVAATQVKWIVRRYAAEGVITVLTGKPKQSGKTTLAAYMIKAVLNGSPFLGDVTTKTPVVWMTEERATFEEMLRRTGLLGRSDLKFLRFDPTRDATFTEQIMAAIEVCKEIGAKLLVVDTVAQFMSVRGDDVKESGFWLEELKPIQQAAQQGMAIILTHHERKSGGDVGDSSLGSTSFTGAGDIILSLRRPDNASHDTKVRVIQALSRFPATPDTQFIELTPEGYVAKSEAGVITSSTEKIILDNAPPVETAAKTLEEIIAGTDLKSPAAYKAATKLVEGKFLGRTGEGGKGHPFRYWRLPEDSSIPSAPMGKGINVVPAQPPLPPAVASQEVFIPNLGLPAPVVATPPEASAILPVASPGLLATAQASPVPVPVNGTPITPAMVLPGQMMLPLPVPAPQPPPATGAEPSQPAKA
jgi:hypothetical protein